jgi:hypothetical protein
LFDDEANVSDEQDVIEDPWVTNTTVEVYRGNIHERFIKLNFHGEFRREIRKVLIYTNDGKSQYFKPNIGMNDQTQTFKWDNLGITNPNHKDLDVVSVQLLDVNHKLHVIYKNPDVKYLDSFFENIEK